MTSVGFIHWSSTFRKLQSAAPQHQALTPRNEKEGGNPFWGQTEIEEVIQSRAE
jgi:hypothetical protein